MTWREKMCARILLLVARMLAGSAELEREIGHVSNAIHCAPTRDDSYLLGAEKP